MSVRPIKKCVHRLKMSIVCPQNDFHPFNISDSHNNHLYHARFLYGCPIPLMMTWNPDTCLDHSIVNDKSIYTFARLLRRICVAKQHLPLQIRAHPAGGFMDHTHLLPSVSFSRHPPKYLRHAPQHRHIQ